MTAAIGLLDVLEHAVIGVVKPMHIKSRKLGWLHQPSASGTSMAGLMKPTQPTGSR